MLRVPLVERNGAKVCASGVWSVLEWYSIESDMVPATLRAVHPACVKRVHRPALVLKTGAGVAGSRDSCSGAGTDGAEEGVGNARRMGDHGQC
jgi:hypothetical protein